MAAQVAVPPVKIVTDYEGSGVYSLKATTSQEHRHTRSPPHSYSLSRLECQSRWRCPRTRLSPPKRVQLFKAKLYEHRLTRSPPQTPLTKQALLPEQVALPEIITS
jgi:hypothetical protein